MNINFELYKVFYVVANNKSISKGAEYLSISQPAVTQAIHNLESQLSTTLFIRTKKGIVLTKEGEELYSYIKEGMNYFLNGTNKIYNLKNLESGVIKIGASTSITENYLMTYINKFHKIYPNIEIKIVNNLTDELLRELRNGNIDIVIGLESFKDNKDLKFNLLNEIEYIFISDKKLNLSLDEILKENLVLQTSPSISRTIFDVFIKDNNNFYDKCMEVVSHRLLVQFVKSGFGIGFAVKQYIEDEINNELIYEIKTNCNLPRRKIGYLIRDNFVPSCAVSEFIKIIKNK